LNGTHHFLVCANDVDLMGKSVYSRKKDTKVLLFGSKYIGLEADAEKTKRIFVWHEQKTGKNHNLKTGI
jgi:hypothetical protein